MVALCGSLIIHTNKIQAMSKEKNKEQRPVAYPKPTETDKQLDNQDEFIQPQTDKKTAEKPVLKDDAEVNKTKKNSGI